MYMSGRRLTTERADACAMRKDVRRVEKKEMGGENEKSRRNDKKGR